MCFDDVVAMVGVDLAEVLRDRTLAVYSRAAELAADRGLILADTKLEFGISGDGNLVLGDEVLTPDSSRYWLAADWTPGQPQASYDKQYVHDWLTNESGWDRPSGSPPPELPAHVVAGIRERYLAAYELLTGAALPLPPYPTPPPREGAVDSLSGGAPALAMLAGWFADVSSPEWRGHSPAARRSRPAGRPGSCETAR